MNIFITDNSIYYMNEIYIGVKYILDTIYLYSPKLFENVTTKLMIQFRPTLDYIYNNLII